MEFRRNMPPYGWSSVGREFRERNKIIVILGPTSSGKSDVAIRLAKKFNGEIISADSRQVYRGLDLGTGKIQKDALSPLPPTPSPLGRGRGEGKIKIYYSNKIPHYLIDTANPKKEYNVSHFKKDANYVINYLHKKGKLPIICGGTGFWIQAVVDNVNFPEVKPDAELRKRLGQKDTEILFKMLQKMDQKRAKTIDKCNKVRLIRAIEICKAIGKVPPLSSAPSPIGRGWSCLAGPGEGKNNYDFLQIGIDMPQEKLYENIKKRLEKRFKAGLIKEVEKLHAEGLSWKKIQSFGLAYYWIPLFLQNKLPTTSCLGNKLLERKLAEKILFEKIYQAEKNYAKRQMTWFKKDKRIVWLRKYNEIKKAVSEFTS